jgi:hypothetical protein
MESKSIVSADIKAQAEIEELARKHFVPKKNKDAEVYTQVVGHNPNGWKKHLKSFNAGFIEGKQTQFKESQPTAVQDWRIVNAADFKTAAGLYAHSLNLCAKENDLRGKEIKKLQSEVEEWKVKATERGNKWHQANAELEKLKQQPTEVERMKWVKVEDELPLTAQPVLLFGDGYSEEPFIGCLRHGGGFKDNEIGPQRINAEITHWMPLPAPPPLDSTPNTQADEDVRDYEASDKATSIVPCDAPVDSK